MLPTKMRSTYPNRAAFQPNSVSSYLATLMGVQCPPAFGVPRPGRLMCRL